MKRQTLFFFACTISLAGCGGRTLLSEPNGGEGEPEGGSLPDGSTAPDGSTGPDGRTEPDVTVQPDAPPQLDAPELPDVTPPPPPPPPPPVDAEPPPNTYTYPGGLTCVAGATVGSGGSGGACSIDFKGHCNRDVTFEIDCQCPQKTCFCSASNKTMGGGGGGLKYDGCSSSCSMEAAWKACADVFMGL